MSRLVPTVTAGTVRWCTGCHPSDAARHQDCRVARPPSFSALVTSWVCVTNLRHAANAGQASRHTEPTLGRLDVGEVGPFLVRGGCGELSIRHIRSHGIGLLITVIPRQLAFPGAGT